MTSRRLHGHPNYGYEDNRSFGGQHSPVEEENDGLADGLRDKIRALKSVSVEIGDEVRLHNRLLQDMDDEFEKGKGFLHSTMTRVIKLGKAGHNYYILYLLLFSCAVFFLIWVIKKLG